MPKKQNILKEIVYNHYAEFKHVKLTSSELESSNYKTEVNSIYKQLGGILNEAPINYGPWDISTKDFIIEVDEELHFNRYRLITLESKIYQFSNSFVTNQYKKYCIDKENNCLKAGGFGGKWKNNSTEKMFVKSSTPGDLNGTGSSRWRQRAYYDCLKDLTSVIKGIPIYRISIYDEFDGQKINELLSSENKSKILLMLRSYLTK